MTLYPDPVYNKEAPNYRLHLWAKVGKVDVPFVGDPPPDQFGFWFNYFWEEAKAKPGLTDAEKSKLCDMFFRVFEEKNGQYVQRSTFAATEDSQKESILRQILLIGFRRVAMEAPQIAPYKAAGGRRLAPPPLKAVDAATLNWEYSVILSQAQKFKIGFRSDTRSYEDLVRCQGFNARARQNGWVHTGYAFNQRWNPFNNPVYSNSLFLRLGDKNKDACLHTVVSSGANFHEVVHFPILNDYGNNFKARSASGEYLAVKPAELWTDADIQLAANDRMKVRAVKSTTGQGVDHVERDSHVHVFHATGLRGYDTGAHFGGSFPERSMHDIPVANVLADLPFIQKWWYDPVTERQIIFYDVEFAPIRWVPSEQAVEALLGEPGKRALQQIIEREIDKARGRGQDVVPNRAAYEKYQREKATMLTALEKAEIYSKLGDYIGSVRNAVTGKYPPDRKKEQAKMIADLPALKTKIERAEALLWADIRKEAMRLKGWG